MLYESLLLLGVLSVTLLLPHLAIGMALHRVAPGGWLLAHAVLVVGIYFTWFWRRSGQTLAMQTWHLRLERRDGTWPISLGQALLRCCLSMNRSQQPCRADAGATPMNRRCEQAQAPVPRRCEEAEGRRSNLARSALRRAAWQEIASSLRSSQRQSGNDAPIHQLPGRHLRVGCAHPTSLLPALLFAHFALKAVCRRFHWQRGSWSVCRSRTGNRCRAWPGVLSGASLVWALFDRNHQFLHDRLAGTRLVRVDA